MTFRTRSILLILAWITFLIIAPLAVAYSLGHRISFTDQGSTSVGAILFRTFPRGATVLLNENERQRKAPGSVRALEEGYHTVRIEKEGYRPWEKQLFVAGTRITDIRHVRLIPEHIQEDVIRSPVTTFSISPNERWLITAEPLENRIRLRSVRHGGIIRGELEVVTDTSISQDADIGFLWDPDSDLVLLRIEDDDTLFHLFDPEAETFLDLSDIDDVLGWLPGNTDRMVFLKGTTLFHADPEDLSSRTIISENVIDASVFSGGIIAAHNTSPSFIRYSRSGNMVRSIPDPPLDEKTVHRISASPFGDVALVANPNQSLILWDDENRVWRSVSDHGEKPEWSPDGEKLLWQETEFDIYVMNVRERRTVLSRFSPILMIRSSVPIHTPVWFAGSQHVLYRMDGEIHITEIDPRDGNYTAKLLETHIPKAEIRVVEDGKSVYTIGEREGVPSLIQFFMYTEADL